MHGGSRCLIYGVALIECIGGGRWVGTIQPDSEMT